MDDPARGQTASLSPEALEDFLSSGVTALIPHGKDGRHELKIDPARQEFTLRSPADGTYEDSKDLENVVVDLDEVQGTNEYVLKVSAEDAPDAAYALTYAIVRETDKGASYARALTSAVEQFRNLLRARRRLTPAQETGLIGELTVLLQLFRSIGVEATIDAWLGPEAEQHDFGLEGYDLEVKTTLSEHRRHVIHGLDQLTPTEGRPLWLLSLQFTAAGRGEGESLTRLARRVVMEAASHAMAVRRALDMAGWHEEDAELYAKRYMLRATPRCYAVDDQFPGITRQRIEGVVPNPGLVGQEVSYRVDVGPLPYRVPGSELQGFVEEAHRD